MRFRRGTVVGIGLITRIPVLTIGRNPVPMIRVRVISRRWDGPWFQHGTSGDRGRLTLFRRRGFRFVSPSGQIRRRILSELTPI